MSGSQHNPNGRQSQLGSGWSPLQLQMANLLARAPQAHMASERGVTWHTPTPPPHLYHVPAPSPPDPLQAMKSVSSNSVFRHTATPPELYRHTPTPPDKHLLRHTPSPGDVKSAAPIPPVDLYPHLGPARDKLVRAEELLAYARVGVDLSLGSRGANGAAPAPAPAPAPSPAPSPALSVRDAPTINSLIARAAPRRVDSLLERLVPSPASPHSVIVHSRVAPTPSPPSSNEDSADSCGAPPGSKRKRKPERTVRVPAPPPPAAPAPAPAPSPLRLEPPAPAPAAGPPPRENGDAAHLHNGPEDEPPSPRAAPSPAPPSPPRPPLNTRTDEPDSSRRKTRSGSAETIDDIAAMIAEGGAPVAPPAAPPPLSVDKLKSVLASPEPPPPAPTPPAAPEPDNKDRPQPASGGAAAESGAAAPRRRPRAEPTNVPVESPSEGKPAEPDAGDAPPAAASFVEVENQLEKMFAGLEEPAAAPAAAPPAPKRRRSAPAAPRRTRPRKKQDAKPKRKEKDHKETKDAYDSGSNASSGRSRGPYIQIRGPRESPVSVCVMNAATGEEEEGGRRRGEERRRGLHASTLGLRYDAATRDHTWVCAFCGRQPHAAGLGDLFGPYTIDTDHEEYRALEEGVRRRVGAEVWLHAECGVWAPGVVAAGARVWGLARAVWAAAGARCRHCGRAAAALACGARACAERAHLPCARDHAWLLTDDDFRALCPLHAPPTPPPPHP